MVKVINFVIALMIILSISCVSAYSSNYLCSSSLDTTDCDLGNRLYNSNVSATPQDSRYLYIPENMIPTHFYMNLTGFNFTNISIKNVEYKKNVTTSPSFGTGYYIRGMTSNGSHIFVFSSSSPISYTDPRIFRYTYSFGGSSVNFTISSWYPSIASDIVGFGTNTSTFFFIDRIKTDGIYYVNKTMYMSNNSGALIGNFTVKALGVLDYVTSFDYNGSIFTIMNNSGSEILFINSSGDSVGKKVLDYIPTEFTQSPYFLTGVNRFKDYFLVDTNSAASYSNKTLVYDSNGHFLGSLTLPTTFTSSTDAMFIVNYKDYNVSYGYNGDNKLYNAVINFTITQPANVTIVDPLDSIYNFSGVLTGTNRTNNLAKKLYDNLQITACIPTNGFCRYPLTFNSERYGQLQVWDILFDNQGFIENSQTYNSTTYDTQNEKFYLNLTYDYLLYPTVSASLVYDGKSYLATQSNNIFSKALDIPVVNTSSNKSFYWAIYMTNISGSTETYNTTLQNQTVIPSILAQCNTTYPTIAVNYTIYNESSFGLISSTFKSNFEWYLGTGVIKKNATFNLAANSNFSFCINTNTTYNVKSTISLSSSGFFDRTFNLIDTYNNTYKNVNLYLLDSSIGRNIILEWKDTSLTGLFGYYMQVNRYYPELNSYVPIQQSVTDNFGQVVGSLIENTVKYKFKFYNSNYSLVKTTNDVTIACRSSICILTFLNDEIINDLDRFNNISNYEYSLLFNNNTNTFVYTWNDNTGSIPFHRLLVEKVGFNGTYSVCNISSNELVGSLSCNVGADVNSYRAQAFRHASPERRIALLNIKVGNFGESMGIEGLIWSFIITMTAIGIGIWNPPVAIGLYLVAMILLGLTGIVYVNPVILIAELVVGIAFIWSFRS